MNSVAIALTTPIRNKIVYVMRHGRTVLDREQRSDGWLDYPLSDDGRVGLIKAQQYLKNAPIKHVYAPSLRRAHETAHIMASGILTHPDLQVAEQARTWNMGMLIGTKKKPNKPIVRYFMDHPDQAPEGGESQQQFAARFIPWIVDRIKQVEQGDGPVLVVTSGSNIREISLVFAGDINTLDLDEGGVLALVPTADGAHGTVLFGGKNGKGDLDS
jgi:broad specificity phosphatase PhoE